MPDIVRVNDVVKCFHCGASYRLDKISLMHGIFPITICPHCRIEGNPGFITSLEFVSLLSSRQIKNVGTFGEV